MRIVAAAILFLLPLAIAPHWFFFYDVTPKLIVLLAGTALAVALTSWSENVFHFDSKLFKWFGILTAAAVCVTVLTAITSNEHALAFIGSSWRRDGAVAQCSIAVLAFLIAVHVRRRPADLEWMLRSLVLAGLVTSIYGILQYFGIDPLLDPGGYHVGEVPFRIVRPPSTLGHSNYFAAFLLTPLFISFAIGMEPDNGIWHRISIMTALVCAAAILLSGSRGGALGLIGGLGFIGYDYRPRWKTALIGGTAIAVLVLLFYISPAGASLRARVHWIGEDLAGGARPWLWRDSISMVLHNPVAGYGPDVFGAAFPAFQSEDLSRAYPDFYHESPHNMLLDALTSGGLLSLAILAGYLGIAVWAVRCASPERRKLALTLAASLFASFVAHQFSVFIIPTAAMFLITVGLLVAIATPYNKTAAEPAPVLTKAICAGFAIIPATLAILVAISDLRLVAIQRDLDRRDDSAAVEHYRGADFGRRFNVEADLYFSRRFVNAATDAESPVTRVSFAHAAYDAAVFATRDPEQRQNAWYNLAGLAAAQNDLEGTERSLSAAIHIAPNWFKPHWSLARVFQASGRIDKAQQEARRAVALDGGKHPEVTNTTQEILRSTGLAK